MSVSPQLQRDWDDLARLDPFDSILSRFGKNAHWTESEFFREGEEEITRVFALCERTRVAVNYGVALDFGCGVGRLSRALAARFQECIGADISPVMLDHARTLNRSVTNLRFVQSADTLAVIPAGSVDFAYTARVLQHVPQRALLRRYLAELVRVLKNDGVLVAGLPTSIPWIHRLQPRARLYHLLRSAGFSESLLYERLRLTPMRMVALAEQEVRHILNQAGATVVHVERMPADAHEYPSATYIAVRTGSRGIHG